MTSKLTNQQKFYNELNKTRLNLRAIQNLLQHGDIDVNNLIPPQEAVRPLDIAIMNNDPKFVECLLEYGAEIFLEDYMARNAIKLAVTEGREKALEILLEQPGISADYKIDGLPLLVLATNYAQKDVVHLLLTKGADPNGCKEGQMPPLYYSARNKRGSVADLSAIARDLLNHGADPNQVLKDGETVIGKLQSLKDEAEDLVHPTVVNAIEQQIQSPANGLAKRASVNKVGSPLTATPNKLSLEDLAKLARQSGYLVTVRGNKLSIETPDARPSAPKKTLG